MTHNSGNVMNQYAAFKCQFSCNANSKCVSFFGRYGAVSPDAKVHLDP